MLDYGARFLQSKSARWTTPDPLAEKYCSASPYAFCANNPVRYVDPDGRKIRGVYRLDAEYFRDDIFRILNDNKFVDIRAHFQIEGKRFARIDTKKFNADMSKLTLTIDEIAYLKMLSNAINSKKVFNVEYYSGDFVSIEGAEVFINYMNSKYNGNLGNMMTTKDGNLSTTFIQYLRNGMNVPMPGGSHSFIYSSLQGTERAIISGHEVLGHGIPSAKKMSDNDNNLNAIRVDNLIRRLLGLPQRDGLDHGGGESFHNNPYKLPIQE